MGYGFNAVNAAGTVQIDQDFINARLIAQGTKTVSDSSDPGVTLKLNLNEVFGSDTLPGANPIVLVRPHDFGKYVGGMLLYADWASGYGSSTASFLELRGEAAFDYAIFSVGGTPISDSTTTGLEVYRSDGSIAYSSRHSHPRITDLLFRASYSGYAWPTSMAFPAKSAMPWLLANPLCTTWLGIGETTEWVAGVMMRINNLYSCEVDLMDTVSLVPLPSVAPNPSEGDPYLNTTSRFGICDFR